MIKNGSSATWWDTDGSAALKPYYDDLEQAYEEQRFKVINGGGGQNPQPSPTPAPGSTPIPFPTTVPVPGDIPTFKELVAPALAGGAAVINMTQGAWECMAEAVSSLWNKMIGRLIMLILKFLRKLLIKFYLVVIPIMYIIHIVITVVSMCI